MTEVAYSLEAMRSLLMLDSTERDRAIETIEKLRSAYGTLCAERDVAAAAGISSTKPTGGETGAKEPATEDEKSAGDAGEASGGDAETEPETPADPADEIETTPEPVTKHIPGTLPLGTSGKFCLAPFSKTGDFVVALDDNITVVSLIDVIDGLNKASSE